MAKNTHLTLEDRIIIEVSLKNGESFAEIGRKLEKDPSTISKEVRNHIKIVRNKSYNPCANRASCFKIATVCKSCSAQFRYLCKRCVEYRCYELCTDFVELTCQRLKKPPYICDNCIRRMRCKLERHLYSAKNAQDEYEAMQIIRKSLDQTTIEQATDSLLNMFEKTKDNEVLIKNILVSTKHQK